MSDIEINTIVKPYLSDFEILTKEQYKKLADIKKEPKYVISNLDSGSGSHWVSFVRNKDNSVTYFDSLGGPPPITLKDRIIHYSPLKIQPLNSKYCGALAIASLFT